MSLWLRTLETCSRPLDLSYWIQCCDRLWEVPVDQRDFKGVWSNSWAAVSHSIPLQDHINAPFLKWLIPRWDMLSLHRAFTGSGAMTSSLHIMELLNFQHWWFLIDHFRETPQWFPKSFQKIPNRYPVLWTPTSSAFHRSVCISHVYTGVMTSLWGAVLVLSGTMSLQNTTGIHMSTSHSTDVLVHLVLSSISGCSVVRSGILQVQMFYRCCVLTHGGSLLPRWVYWKQRMVSFPRTKGWNGSKGQVRPHGH